MVPDVCDEATQLCTFVPDEWTRCTYNPVRSDNGQSAGTAKCYYRHRDGTPDEFRNLFGLRCPAMAAEFNAAGQLCPAKRRKRAETKLERTIRERQWKGPQTLDKA